MLYMRGVDLFLFCNLEVLFVCMVQFLGVFTVIAYTWGKEFTFTMFFVSFFMLFNTYMIYFLSNNMNFPSKHPCLVTVNRFNGKKWNRKNWNRKLNRFNGKNRNWKNWNWKLNRFNGRLITILIFIVPLLLHLLIPVAHQTSVKCLKMSERNLHFTGGEKNLT